MDPCSDSIKNILQHATRLLSKAGGSRLEFTEVRYCAIIPEDARVASDVTTVVAIPKEGESVKYSITGGNQGGLFSIDQDTGTISVAAPLDYELRDKILEGHIDIRYATDEKLSTNFMKNISLLNTGWFSGHLNI
ncbi:putative neural-cadherin 2 [Penaeus vannamei]|uniref:putative neural-cadherin 2 n=1 Tax=Penaeus vannamei TaxID=6689 RepID=UPI00387F5075